MTWTVRDDRFDGVRVTLDAVPMAGANGFVMRLAGEGTRPGDRLVWAYGSILQGEGPLDPTSNSGVREGFMPEECRDTVVGTGENGLLHVGAIPSGKGSRAAGSGQKLIAGRCSTASEMAVADAAAWKDPVVFSTSKLAGLPILRGSTALGANCEVLWVCEAFDGDKPGNLARLLDPAKTLPTASAARRDWRPESPPQLPNRVSRHSSYLHAAELDGMWYPPVFVHATTPPWNMPYLGWYTIYGNTICGWHDRIKEAAAFSLGSQVRQSPKIRAKSDPARRYCIEHPDSHFCCVGHIPTRQSRYDMQSQFFDQLVNEWRWTGDPGSGAAASSRPRVALAVGRRPCF